MIRVDGFSDQFGRFPLFIVKKERAESYEEDNSYELYAPRDNNIRNGFYYVYEFLHRPFSFKYNGEEIPIGARRTVSGTSFLQSVC